MYFCFSTRIFCKRLIGIYSRAYMELMNVIPELPLSGEPIESTNADTFHIEDTEITILSDSGTRIVTAVKYAQMFPLHAHPHYEAFFVYQGTLLVLFQNGEELLQPHDLMIISPKVEHLTLWTGENSNRYNVKFHIRKNALSLETSLYRELSAAFANDYILLRNCPEYEETFRNLHTFTIQQNKLYECYYFHEFLVRFLSLESSHKKQAQKKPVHLETNIMRLHTVSYIINGGFKNNITLEYVASVLNLSVRQTNRIIQKNYGVPFSKLILEQKMQYAAKLLSDSSLSIAEIAKRSGYSTTKGFYYSFKKKYQMLPSEYRKKYTGNKNDVELTGSTQIPATENDVRIMERNT